VTEASVYDELVSCFFTQGLVVELALMPIRVCSLPLSQHTDSEGLSFTNDSRWQLVDGWFPVEHWSGDLSAARHDDASRRLSRSRRGQPPLSSRRPAMVTFVTMQLVWTQQLQATEAVTTTGIHQSVRRSPWQQQQHLTLTARHAVCLTVRAKIAGSWYTGITNRN